MRLVCLHRTYIDILFSPPEHEAVDLVLGEQVRQSGSTSQEIRFDGCPEIEGTRRLRAEDHYVRKVVPHVRGQWREWRNLAEDAACGKNRVDCADHKPGRGKQKIACVILDVAQYLGRGLCLVEGGSLLRQ